MTLIEQVNNMNLDDLRTLNKLAVSRINELTANYRFNFKKGDLVTVKMNGRNTAPGVVEKVMRKNVQVKVMNEDGLIRGIYNCTPTLLTHRSK